VYVIGEEGILKELELAGFQYLGGPVSNNFSEIHDRTLVQKTSFTDTLVHYNVSEPTYHGYQSVFTNSTVQSLNTNLRNLDFIVM